jgi:hypothetical protein
MTKPVNGVQALKDAGWRRKGDSLLKLTHDSGARVQRDASGLWLAFDAEGREVAGSPFVNVASARTAARTAGPKVPT